MYLEITKIQPVCHFWSEDTEHVVLVGTLGLPFPADTDLKQFRHTFLIRTPQKTIPSYYRATLGDCGDFGEFDPGEAGFTELRALLVGTI